MNSKYFNIDVQAYVDELERPTVVSLSHYTLRALYRTYNPALVDRAVSAELSRRERQEPV